MHPHFPSTSYCWPRRADECYVPKVNVVCKINPPSTRTGRQYSLESNDIKRIEDEMRKKDIVQNLILQP